MPILDSLLEAVADNAAAAEPLDLCIGAHWTVAVVKLRGEVRAGLSSTLHGGDDDHHHGKRPPVRDAGHLLEKAVGEWAALARSASVLEASIGLATINALLEGYGEESEAVNALDVIIERGRGKRVVVVGHFPFTAKIRAAAARLWVLELDPREGDLPAARAPEIIPQADVVALTGTSILNHTFDDLVALCRPEAFVVVLGGTTPLSEVLFDVGVDALAGTRVVDPGAALRSAAQGATFKQLEGKALLTLFRRA
ncbi:MAG: Rossmann-like domain-containing protein [Anaerolineales bacterium]